MSNQGSVQPKNGLSPVTQNHSMIEVVGLLKGAKGVDKGSFSRPSNVTDALQCFTYLLFVRLRFFIVKNHFEYFGRVRRAWTAQKCLRNL